MSKIPPQGRYAIPQILNLFFSHNANIRFLIPSSGDQLLLFVPKILLRMTSTTATITANSVAHQKPLT